MTYNDGLFSPFVAIHGRAAIGSNIGFVAYGAIHPSYPMMLLHGALLPINIFRAVEMVRLTRRVSASAAQRDLSGVWLRPYMRSRHLKAGHVLFRKGDAAEHLRHQRFQPCAASGFGIGDFAQIQVDRQRRARRVGLAPLQQPLRQHLAGDCLAHTEITEQRRHS